MITIHIPIPNNTKLEGRLLQLSLFYFIFFNLLILINFVNYLTSIYRNDVM